MYLWLPVAGVTQVEGLPSANGHHPWPFNCQPSITHCMKGGHIQQCSGQLGCSLGMATNNHDGCRSAPVNQPQTCRLMLHGAWWLAVHHFVVLSVNLMPSRLSLSLSNDQSPSATHLSCGLRPYIKGHGCPRPYKVKADSPTHLLFCSTVRGRPLLDHDQDLTDLMNCLPVLPQYELFTPLTLTVDLQDREQPDSTPWTNITQGSEHLTTYGCWKQYKKSIIILGDGWSTMIVR